MRLRTKIFIGFLVLILILFMADLWLVYKMNHMKNSVQTVLRDSYSALQATHMMRQGLDNLNDGFVTILAGRWEEGSRLLRLGDQTFQKGLKGGRGSVKGRKEEKLLLQIAQNYAQLKAVSAQFHLKAISQKDVSWYEAHIYNLIKKMETNILHLDSLLDKNLYEANIQLKDRTQRILMPAIVAMLAAILFLFLFNYFIDYFLIRPIRMITRSVQDLLEKRRPFQVDIATEDELGDLATSIATLCSQNNPGDLEK